MGQDLRPRELEPRTRHAAPSWFTRPADRPSAERAAPAA
jgi:hypothetical protein